MKYLTTILLLVSCATADDKQRPEPSERDILAMEHEALSNRLIRQHSQDGWVVSRENGEPRHMGDSLLWTGIAMGVTTCEAGDNFSQRMRRMLKDNNGALVRYEPLPDEYKDGREISFDGATGLYFGVLARLMRCSTHLGDWDSVWDLHLASLERNHGYLHPNSRAAVEPPFDVLRDFITHKFGRGAKPSGTRIAALETAATAWAYGVRTSKASCFRIHLAWLYLRSLERLNELSENGRDAFCVATDGTDIPLIDHWCGRVHVSEWDFKINEWEYRHQRCGAWETPDGKGYETPALDYIFSIDEVLDE